MRNNESRVTKERKRKMGGGMKGDKRGIMKEES